MRTAPRGLSQFATSFIASACQGIHRMPLHVCPSFTFERRSQKYAIVKEPRRALKAPASLSITYSAKSRGGPSRHPRGSRDSTVLCLPVGSPCSRDGLPRKEVIQPQVPLRLPCYDFTPITTHTFGAYLPAGLAQRLLVHTAFVV